MGRPDAAASGKLNILAACDPVMLVGVRPLLEAMGQRVWFLGAEPHQANVVKLAINFMLAAAIEALSEAASLAERYEINPANLIELATGTLFACPAYITYGGLIVDREFKPGFRLRLGLKDMRLALAAGEERGVPLPFVSVIRDNLIDAIGHGDGDSDWSAFGGCSASSRRDRRLIYPVRGLNNVRSFMRSSHVPCTKPYFGCNFRRTFPAEPNTRNAVPIGRFILLIGVPKETKDHESRVGVAPAGVHELFCNGHRVLIQKEAGRGAGISDDELNWLGGTIVEDASSIWSSADLIVKVKEPSATERQQLQPGQILFTYLHLAPDTEQADDLIRSQATCIAYETVTGPGGGLPLLTPMSEV